MIKCIKKIQNYNLLKSNPPIFGIASLLDYFTIKGTR